jgi:nucleoid-associated protein YgaU
MTRETKIGLLVGLAFIIVIGILLSDWTTGVREEKPAPLQLAGNNVRSGLGQPATDNAPPVVVTPPNVTPNQTVLTRDELQPRRTAPPAQPPITLANQDNTGGSTHDNLVAVARRGGEELVDSHGQSLTNDTQADQQQVMQQAVRPTAPTPAAGTYKAEPGDNLTKICAKAYGTSTKALRDGIVAANPSLHDNPNRIIVGHSYVIPPQNGGATATNTQTTAVLPTPQQIATQSQQPTTTPEHVYVVQSGDTLWSIARDEVGNTAAVAAIRDLNQDVLKGSDRLRANMKLRLPAKPVAQAN